MTSFEIGLYLWLVFSVQFLQWRVWRKYEREMLVNLYGTMCEIG